MRLRLIIALVLIIPALVIGAYLETQDLGHANAGGYTTTYIAYPTTQQSSTTIFAHTTAISAGGNTTATQPSASTVSTSVHTTAPTTTIYIWG